MVSFSEAVNVQQDTTPNDDPAKVYRGLVDSDWVVGVVPQGGYVLALMIESCMKYQSSTAHPDPIHVSAHYLHSTSIGPFTVHVRKLKQGRGFSNVVADLIQNDLTKVTTHMIFGVLAPSQTDPGLRLTLKPPSPYARRLPLSDHPSTFDHPSNILRTVGFASHVKVFSDPVIRARNSPDSPTRTDSTTIGGGGLEWGAWVQFVDEGDRITTPSLAFLADLFAKGTLLLPQNERPGLGVSWRPTMTLSIEFKFPIPSPSLDHSSRTIGVYSCGRFINDPQGRQDLGVELWTAPSNIGEGEPGEGWRDKQVCLAISTQMALTIPMEVNHRRGEKL